MSKLLETKITLAERRECYDVYPVRRPPADCLSICTAPTCPRPASRQSDQHQSDPTLIAPVILTLSPPYLSICLTLEQSSHSNEALFGAQHNTDIDKVK